MFVPNDGGYGLVAYEAYGESVGWQNFKGDPMPLWPELPVYIQRAWKAAAESVVQEVYWINDMKYPQS